MKLFIFPAAGWLAAMILAGATASAQVKPPGAQDTDGNAYRYPVAAWDPPVVRVRSTDPRRHDPARIVQRRLETVSISRLTFQDTPLRDAIERIDVECALHDEDSGFPRTGFAYLQPDPGTPGWDTRLTTTLGPMTVADALQIVSRLAAMEVRIDSSGMVTFQTPFDMARPMATLNLPVPPGRMDAPLDLAASPTWRETLTAGLVCTDAQTWLADRGVTFPTGATVLYVSAWHRLYVYDTPDNLDRIKSLLAPPTASP